MQWKGASFGKATWHFWMQGEGVFGVALSVSTSLIFLFVLFGAILEKAGAGNYFIKIAFALLGHLRGGPAKAAVVASAMSGLYSGSSIANVVTTGTFTIPLMKRTGFSPEKAGAVEVASSTNGQLTPPVMGAAAFLIAEFTGVPYTEIIKIALVPALVSYIALVYIVHLEIVALATIVKFGMGWIKVAMPDQAFLIVSIGVAAAYIFLLWLASKRPDLVVDDPNAPVEELPPAGATAITGLYFILPIVILIWCIVVERLSPALSAFWATIAMIIVALTQHPIKAIMRGEWAELGHAIRRGIDQWVDGMISGSRNMIGIGVATGAAGIIEFLSGGSLMIMLLLVALMSLLLGMGLPTTANYIVVSSLMAPVIVIVGAQSGLVVPLIAAHMFVFYFGILADDTPPVGLAAFAAAAISGGDPIKTGIQGFMYDIRTALLPFLFIFNTDLLLINVGWLQGIMVFAVAVVAMMCFAAATQGYFFARNKIWEAPVLLLVAFTLFRPGFWLDQIEPPYHHYEGPAVIEAATGLPAGSEMRVVVSGPDFDSGKVSESTFVPTLAAGADGAERLSAAGLAVVAEDGVVKVEDPTFGSAYFEQLSRGFDFYGDEPVQIVRAEVEADRMHKEWFFLPAFVLLLLLIQVQRRRATQPAF
jgi:TRAP transporter 4TM/12TM fusion protein